MPTKILTCTTIANRGRSEHARDIILYFPCRRCYTVKNHIHTIREYDGRCILYILRLQLLLSYRYINIFWNYIQVQQTGYTFMLRELYVKAQALSTQASIFAYIHVTLESYFRNGCFAKRKIFHLTLEFMLLRAAPHIFIPFALLYTVFFLFSEKEIQKFWCSAVSVSMWHHIISLHARRVCIVQSLRKALFILSVVILQYNKCRKKGQIKQIAGLKGLKLQSSTFLIFFVSVKKRFIEGKRSVAYSLVLVSVRQRTLKYPKSSQSKENLIFRL